MGGMRRIKRPPVQEKRRCHTQMLGTHGHGQVVNQPNTIQPSGHQCPTGAREIIHRPQARSRTNHGILNFKTVGFQGVSHHFFCGGWMVCRRGCLQGEIHGPRFLPGRIRQPLISAGSGQSIGFTRRGHGMNSGPAVSAHHGLHQLQLLPIFFTSSIFAVMPQPTSWSPSKQVCFNSGVSMPEKRIFSPFKTMVSPSTTLKLSAKLVLQNIKTKKTYRDSFFI